MPYTSLNIYYIKKCESTIPSSINALFVLGLQLDSKTSQMGHWNLHLRQPKKEKQPCLFCHICSLLYQTAIWCFVENDYIIGKSGKLYFKTNKEMLSGWKCQVCVNITYNLQCRRLLRQLGPTCVIGSGPVVFCSNPTTNLGPIRANANQSVMLSPCQRLACSCRNP